MSRRDLQGRRKASRPHLNAAATDLWRIVVLSGILAYTLLVFAKATGHQFVSYDDPHYITNNPLIRELSLRGVWRILTTPVIGMYNPIPFIVYAFQYNVWGLEPEAYHWMSLALHLLATAVLYHFVMRLTRRHEAAAIVTLLFAVHPMHVSVVTWASQTKTSLFFIFYILGLMQYLRYAADGQGTVRLVYAFILFVLSALSKPSAVTFAPMLLVMDYYLSRKVDRRLIVEKVPFFAAALAFGILTLATHAQIADSIFTVRHGQSAINQLIIANYSVAFYVEKFFYPVGLSLIYPYPDQAAWLPFRYYATLLVMPVAAWLVWRSGVFRKEIVFGLLFFAVSISVLIRPVPSGFFGASNQYAYLSYVGLFFIVGQFAVYVIDGKVVCPSRLKACLAGGLLGFVVFCSWRTTGRIDVWRDSITLFSDVIQKHPTFAAGYVQRAVARSAVGDHSGAISDATVAMDLDPGNAEAPHNRGVVRVALKQYDEALKDFDAALRRNPHYANAYYSRANLKIIRGDMAGALADYDSAIARYPGFGKAYFNRAFVKKNLGDLRGSAEDLKRAAALGLPEANGERSFSN